MLEISLRTVANFARLGETWAALQENAEVSFFQSWAWTGCLAEERFPRPVLLEVRDGPNIVALGLFNLQPGSFGRQTLWLGESGITDLDALFIEHNGLILARNQASSLLAQCLCTVQTAPIGEAKARRRRRVVLNGVPSEYIAAARSVPGVVRLESTRPAPFVDLRAIRQSHGNFLTSVSPNFRYQLRRSERHYENLGNLSARRADSPSEAIDFLLRLVRLHQTYWVARGKTGAFANQFMMRFHTVLIHRAFGDGTIDLIEIKAGETVVGYLYNFKYRGRVYAYQSGFDYVLPHRHCKPGLTCHHLAIEMYLSEGANIYDFMAGQARYKESLANSASTLHWATIYPRLSAGGLVASGKNWYTSALKSPFVG